MAVKATKSTKAKAKIAPARASYHHGDLRQTLIDEALRMADHGGPEAVNIRETARRSGVSPGAPFRHFADRRALMTAVAEEAQRRFRGEIRLALEVAGAEDPVARFRAFGLAYLRWALRHPGHFAVISSGGLFDYDRSPALLQDNAELIAMIDSVLSDAVAQGSFANSDVRLMRIAGRALVYGFARMNLDGHFPRWGVADAEVEHLAEAVLDLFIAGLEKPRSSR